MPSGNNAKLTTAEMPAVRIFAASPSGLAIPESRNHLDASDIPNATLRAVTKGEAISTAPITIPAINHPRLAFTSRNDSG